MLPNHTQQSLYYLHDGVSRAFTMVCVELTNQLVRKRLFSHLDRRQKPPECSRKGRYIFVHVKYEAYLFLLVFLVAQGFLETLACPVILVHPVALEPLADLAHQEVLRWFALRQTGLESGSELSYILPCDLSGKKCPHSQVVVENLVQLSLNRALAGPQGCGLSCFDNMKLCACQWENSLGSTQKRGRTIVYNIISLL